MPNVVHHGRKRQTFDYAGSFEYSTKCGVDGEFSNLNLTRKKEQVTCKKCLRKLGIEPAPARPKRRNRPRNAWDHLDAIPDEGAAASSLDEFLVPAPVPEPTPEPAPTHVFAGDAVGSGGWEPPPPAVVGGSLQRSERDMVAHRIALVFFHLMRSHMGVEQVTQLAEMCSHSVEGSGRDYDMLMARAQDLAALIMVPVFLRR